MEVPLRWAAAGLIVLGAGVFVFLYQASERRVDRSSREPLIHWPLYTVIDWYLKLSTLALSIAAILTDRPWLLELYDHPLPLIAGLLIAGGGLVLFAWAMRNLGSQYSPAHQSLLPLKVVVTGPYRYLRHPVYTANVLILSGMLIVSGSLWLLLNLLVLLTYYALVISREEEAIAARFTDYQEYRRHTGRLLPRLFPRRK